MHEWVATPEFIEVYKRLDDRRAAVVDDAVRKLLRNPQDSWARQGRVVGERWSAWIVEFRGAGREFALYWTHGDADDVVILAFLAVR
ncbi:MAG: hypothetical protein WEA76_00290 [Acidimicrobiia bacterium]